MVLRIGHRGAPKHAPENSLAGFLKALELGADAVEFDVRATEGGTVMLLHDPAVDRTTDGRGKIARMSFAATRQLRLANGERIPTLTEALDLLKGRCPVKIDMKVRGIVEETVRDIKRASMVREVIVMAYGREEIAAFREALPQVVIEVGGVIYRHRRGLAIRAAKAHGATIISSQHRVTTKGFVADCRTAGLGVHVWTVNEKPLADRMRKYGVAGITTDRLDVI